MNVHSGPIKKGRKYDHVLNGAREIFLRDGFEGASVDAIAKAAGVSKATLYSYFSEKSILFIEVARTECRRQADPALAALDLSAPPREVMSRAGHHMMEFLLDIWICFLVVVTVLISIKTERTFKPNLELVLVVVVPLTHLMYC